MNKREKIQKKQDIEESRFLEWINMNPNVKWHEFTPLEESYDAKIRSGITQQIAILCEVKVRDYDVAFFNKFGPYLEKKKIDGMFDKKFYLKHSKGIETLMMYFNFCPDGLQIFYLKNPWEYNFVERMLPKDNIDTDILVPKMVAELYNPVEVFHYKPVK